MKTANTNGDNSENDSSSYYNKIGMQHITTFCAASLSGCIA